MPYSNRERQRVAQREHYAANKPRYIKKARESGIRCSTRNRNFVYEYLLVHPCIDCDEADPIVLQFDHRDGDAKVANISDLVSKSSLERLLREIEKCDVRCSNCHLKRTAREQGWYAYRAAVV